MSEKLIAKKSERLISLDVFRGITIAGMICVNNPGTWSIMYKPLGHAKWNGWTPTDLIFPFFLFIVGVAMTFSFDKRLTRGDSKIRLFEQVVRRTIIIYFIGLIMGGYPNWRLMCPYILTIVGLGFLFANEPPLNFGKTGKETINKILAWVLLIGAVVYFIFDLKYFNDKGLRLVGVLPRIALCYFFTSIIVFFTKIRGRVIWAVCLIILYWIIMKLFSAPAGYTIPAKATLDSLGGGFPDGLLNDWIDVKLLGNHLYRHRPDPEGLLSTIPAIATTLAGVLCGNWLHTNRSKEEKLIGMFFWGNVLIFIGICINYWFPINKKIWSSSYVVFCAGMALQFLSMCFYLIDIKGYQKWAYPFKAFGTNPLFLFFASGIVARILYKIRIPKEGGLGNPFVWLYKNFLAALGIIPPETAGTDALKTWIYENLYHSWLSPINASLAFALVWIFLWFLVLWPMYRKKIFIKI